jgi:N-acetyl-gamma-glutamyl-phosphate reductase
VPGKIAGGNTGGGELTGYYQDFYQDEPFVKVVTAPPHTKYTLGSNYCFIYPTIDRRTGRLVVISCIDNLVKGAAGQAVQNMNLMLGLPESTGLAMPAVYP